MQRCKTLVWGAVAVMATLLAAESAQAQYWYGNGFGPGTAYNGAWVNERLPFYTQYPPVYYGHPTARPYGYSPFAYTAMAATPQATPMNIVNPYVVEVNAPAAAAAEPPRPTPITIKNPYATETLPPGQTR